jgi:sulfate permease, SulP family
MVLAPDAAGRWTSVPATPGAQTEPGLVIYRFGADLFYANGHRFTDEVRTLVEHAPTPVRWFIVDADAITDLDYSAARSIRELLDDLARRNVTMIFARVSPYLKGRHGPARHHRRDRRDTDFHDAARSHRCGAQRHARGERPSRELLKCGR